MAVAEHATLEASPPHGTRRRGGSPARVFTGRTVPAPARRVQGLMRNLMEVLRTEWKAIRSSNLGVLSGTGVVEELIMAKVQTWVAELHALCIGFDEGAASALAAQAAKLSREELEELQVLLDETSHQELSDFIRVMVFNTANPFAKSPVGDLSPLRTSQRRKARARASAAVGQAATAPFKASTSPRLKLRPLQPGELRFTALLQPGDRLTHKAYQLQRERREAELEQQHLEQERLEALRHSTGGSGSRTSGRSSKTPPGTTDMLDSSIDQLLVPRQVRRVRGGAAGFRPLSPGSEALVGPSGVAYFLDDIGDVFRETVCTRMPEEGMGPLWLNEAVPVYASPPDHAKQRAAAAAAAAAAAQQMHALWVSRPASATSTPASNIAPRSVAGSYVGYGRAATLRANGAGTPSGVATPSGSMRPPAYGPGTGGGGNLRGSGFGLAPPGRQHMRVSIMGVPGPGAATPGGPSAAASPVPPIMEQQQQGGAASPPQAQEEPSLSRLGGGEERGRGASNAESRLGRPVAPS